MEKRKNSQKSISINVKSPKSTPRHADKIYLFNFKFKKLCPVRSMKKLKKLQLSNELFSKDFPVFRLEPHTFLTQKNINSFLMSSFKIFYIRGLVSEPVFPLQSQIFLISQTTITSCVAEDGVQKFFPLTKRQKIIKKDGFSVKSKRLLQF